LIDYLLFLQVRTSRQPAFRWFANTISFSFAGGRGHVIWVHGTEDSVSEPKAR
jgi:hypothetical protein